MHLIYKNLMKTTRPFRYELNQTPYNYTVEVTSRFKGLEMIERNAWRIKDRGSDQDHPQEKEMQKGKKIV